MPEHCIVGMKAQGDTRAQGPHSVLPFKKFEM